jgi:uncharacterized SAM-dependent methyltransferase
MASAPVMATLKSAVQRRSQPWSLCLVGEDVERKLQDLVAGLTRGTSATGDGKRITSGFAYWGVEATFAWARSCTDPLYPVMKESIESFTSGWHEIRPNLAGERYHYVSFGPGTGQKDATIIRDLMRRNPRLCYVPVDMSAEMLRLAVRGPIRQTGLPADRILPVQLDFSSPTNLMALRTLLRHLAGSESIVFSLLGNTLANFDDDSGLLTTLTAELLRSQDRLVLEAATADRLDDELASAAALEYRQSRSFCEFATSALLRHTNLCIDDTDTLVFHGAVEADKSLLVKVMYQNRTDHPIRFTLLPNRTSEWLPAGDTIRLYLTRKYAATGLKAILSNCNLVESATTHSYFAGDRARASFGMSLMLLTQGTQHQRDRPHSSAEDLWA